MPSSTCMEYIFGSIWSLPYNTAARLLLICITWKMLATVFATECGVMGNYWMTFYWIWIHSKFACYQSSSLPCFLCPIFLEMYIYIWTRGMGRIYVILSDDLDISNHIHDFSSKCTTVSFTSIWGRTPSPLRQRKTTKNSIVSSVNCACEEDVWRSHFWASPDWESFYLRPVSYLRLLKGKRQTRLFLENSNMEYPSLNTFISSIHWEKSIEGVYSN